MNVQKKYQISARDFVKLITIFCMELSKEERMSICPLNFWNLRTSSANNSFGSLLESSEPVTKYSSETPRNLAILYAVSAEGILFCLIPLLILDTLKPASSASFFSVYISIF